MSAQWITFLGIVFVSGCSLAGTILGAKAGIKEASKLTVYRLQELERKVDKHNNLVERMIKVEKEIPRLDAKIDDGQTLISQRIDDRCKFTDERINTIVQRVQHTIGGAQI